MKLCSMCCHANNRESDNSETNSNSIFQSEYVPTLKELINKNFSGLNSSEISDHCETFELILSKFSLTNSPRNNGAFLSDISGILNIAAINTAPLNMLLSILNIANESNILQKILSTKYIKEKNILHLTASYEGDDENFQSLLSFLLNNSEETSELIKKENEENNNPFDIAVKHGELKKADIILTACIDLDILDNILMKTNELDENILHQIAKQNRNDDLLQSLICLIQKHTDDEKLKRLLGIPNKEGETPFDIVIKFGDLNKVETFYEACEKMKISNIVVCNTNRKYCNIFHHAMHSNDDDVFQFLIKCFFKNGLNYKLENLLKEENWYKRNPLHIAADYGDVKRLIFIKKECSDLNIFYNRSDTKTNKGRQEKEKNTNYYITNAYFKSKIITNDIRDICQSSSENSNIHVEN